MKRDGAIGVAVFVLLIATNAMASADAASAGTVRARFAFAGTNEETAGISVRDTAGGLVYSKERPEAREPHDPPRIPDVSFEYANGEIRFVDDAPSGRRGFCLTFGIGPSAGILRPQLRQPVATASGGRATAYVIDPDGATRSTAFEYGAYESRSLSTPADTDCDAEAPPPTPTCDQVAPRSGTEGADTLLGTEGVDFLQALGGDDVLSGAQGDDCLEGGAGIDDLDGKEGADTVTGGDGSDRVVGGADKDVLRGGNGGDILSDGLGANSFEGGAGEDSIFARQSIAESIDCGPGTDLAVVDRKDKVRGCEEVSLPGEPAIQASAPKSGGKGHGGKKRRDSALASGVAGEESFLLTVDRYSARSILLEHLDEAVRVGEICGRAFADKKAVSYLIKLYAGSRKVTPPGWLAGAASFIGSVIGRLWSGASSECTVAKEHAQAAIAIDKQIDEYFAAFPRPSERKNFHRQAVTFTETFTYHERGPLLPDICEWREITNGWGATWGNFDIKYYARGSCP